MSEGVVSLSDQLGRLRQENELFRRALQGTAVIVFSQDRDLRYTWIHNPTAGFTPDSVIGKVEAEINSPRDTATLGPLKQQVLDTGILFRGEVYLEPMGVPSYFDLSVDPVFDADGNVTGITCLAVDITERKRLLEDQQQARLDVEAALAIRDEFLAVAAHELKNPLTTILGSADLLLRRVLRDHLLNDRETQLIKTIKHQAKRVEELVAVLLDTAHLESGSLPIHPDVLDVRSLVERLVNEFGDLVGKNYVFQFDCPPGQVLIRDDAAHLEQVFHNLITNAVKYSPTGGTISVRVECEDAWATISIGDQGIGIPEDAQPHLFEKFYRAANTSTSGMGIGLFVAKEILVLHGGNITVVSKENEGATFIVRLPWVP